MPLPDRFPNVQRQFQRRHPKIDPAKTIRNYSATAWLDLLDSFNMTCLFFLSCFSYLWMGIGRGSMLLFGTKESASSSFVLMFMGIQRADRCMAFFLCIPCRSYFILRCPRTGRVIFVAIVAISPSSDITSIIGSGEVMPKHHSSTGMKKTDDFLANNCQRITGFCVACVP